MLVAFSSSDAHLDRLRRSLHGVPGTHLTNRWSDVESPPAECRCRVLLIEWLHRDPSFPRLQILRRARADDPVILVTRLVAENARLLGRIVLDDIVPFRGIDTHLPESIARLRTPNGSYLCALAERIRCAPHLPDVLRNALSVACGSVQPVRSVNQLAELAGCDRRTLWLHWSRSAENDASLRLQDFLHWVLLLRALGEKSPMASWAHTAEKIGVHRDTLSRWANRHLGTSLGSLGESGTAQAAALSRFERCFGERILNPAPV